MSRRLDYNASYITASSSSSSSDASREIASGLPTVVVDMFLDDVCPDPAVPAATAAANSPSQTIHLPTGAHSNDRPRPSIDIAQGTDEANGSNSRVRGGSRVVHRYHPTSSHGGQHPHYRQQHPQQQQLVMYPVASTTTSGSPSLHDDETKRRKNREAAARCRQRKSERIVKLEEKAKQLKEDNEELEREAVVLHNQIVEIRNTLLEHMHNGCPIRMAT